MKMMDLRTIEEVKKTKTKTQNGDEYNLLPLWCIFSGICLLTQLSLI